MKIGLIHAGFKISMLHHAVKNSLIIKINQNQFIYEEKFML